MTLNMKQNRGFSFVEILFAVACLGILLVPVFKMLGQGTTGVSRNRNEILAQQHASNVMSYAFFLPYDHEFLKVSPPRDVAALEAVLGGNRFDLGMAESQFSRTVAVSEVRPPDWKHTYKIVTVVVRWQENNGLNRNIKLAGLVSR
ncbi:MAG: hypothetical protein CVV42_06800 [Candidatus Riflebacteria bacterium HGW-Riflebacteria-2]|jgi:Tfp pilus assembly protein FimT|nr:MAG: hypothetical protein CVV42_06800 [Candidatus Riflebacteria bacterium HGW-Riflebacteria-2]